MLMSRVDRFQSEKRASRPTEFDHRDRIDEARFEIRPGTIADYHSLAAHHYKAGRPAAPTAVFALVDHQSDDVVNRFCARIDSHHHTKPDPSATVVGVLVRSMPRLACRARDIATNNRYRALHPRARALLLKREMRVISRVIIDPRYRGLGLAVRLVRHALDHPETPYTEALAAMGRVNPFFERAGMRRYDVSRRAEHARLLDVMGELNINPCALSSTTVFNDRLAKLSSSDRAWFEHEMQRWAKRALHLSAKQSSALTNTDDIVPLAREHLLSNCVYYLYRNAKECEHS